MNVSLRAVVGKLNDAIRQSLEGALGFCLARTHFTVEIEHLLFKLAETPDNDFRSIARFFGLDLARHVAEVNRALDKMKAGNSKNPGFAPSLLDALIRAWLYGSLEYNATKIRSGFFVIALLADEDFARVTRDISPEIAKIDISVLRRDFASIVANSGEAGEPVGGAREAAPKGPRIFISYRREEGSLFADSLYDRILASVPDVVLFRDSDTLKPGVLYADKIDETLRNCDILLALIGKKWLRAADQTGARRIDQPDDWVRLEIATALRHGKTVVPCLIGGAKMPAASELPAEIGAISARQAVTLTQARFRRDTDELIEMLKNWRRSAAGAPAA